MPGRMKDRIALISGGGTGMGAATARLFAKEKGFVFIFGREEKSLKDTINQIKSDGHEAKYFCGDVSKIDDVRDIVNKIKQEYGPIDALVNNAGVINSTPEDIISMTEDDWNWLMNINIKGIFNTTKCIIDGLIANSKEGTIVNIASICAHQGCPVYNTYSASKGAVLSYTKSIASQYGPHGIRVNSVSPGVVHTPMSYVEMPDFDDRIEKFDKAHPLGRVGKPDDIANAVLFFSCKESSWITGQDLIVDGGWTLGR